MKPSPDAERLRRINALLESALALPETERETWLQSLPAEQQPLVPALNAMLARAAVETDSFLRRPVEVALDALDALDPEPDRPGDRIGRYRLVREIGVGGMATVWLAEPVDDALQRQVALKLPRTGWSQGLAQRMARERDILASLEHPRIARLYDAGITAEGRPWLAMECVDGLPIDRHAREHRLDVAQRLRLFLQVADAVAHAHARLVVHRDLKPSNILVTPQGEVRLLDFGVAKLLEQDAPPSSQLTQLLGRALTPDYASPEQVAGKPVGVATDVYSLGVVLYELLAGQRPYRLGRDSAAALEEAILAADVPPASTRTAGDRRLARQLRGDLDTILEKALRKNQRDRYASVESLAADIERYLAGEPILAAPHSRSYRLGKFVRRHRLQVGAGLAVGVAVVAGAGVSMWQAKRAVEQAALAQRETQRAQAVQEVLLNLFRSNSLKNPDPIRARQTTARELLDIGAAQAVESLKDSPAAQDDVLNTLADMYYQLGLHDDAVRMREQRLDALRRAYGPSDPRVAEALLALANDVAATDRPMRAVAALDEARRILDAAGDHSSETRGWVLLESAQHQQYYSVAAARRDALAAQQHFRTRPSDWTSHFHAQQAVARAQFIAGEYAAAAAGHDRALELAERHLNGPSAWSITPLVQRAEAHAGDLRLDEAERDLRTALALARRLTGEHSSVTLQTQLKLGGLLHATGRRDEGRRLVQDGIAATERKESNATPSALDAAQRVGAQLLLDDGHLADGHARLASGVDRMRRQLPDSLPLSRLLLLEAEPLTAMGRYDEARRALDEAWGSWRRIAGDAALPALHNRYLIEQARLLLARGASAAAEARLAAVTPPPNAAQLPLRLDETRARLLLAQVRLLQQRPAEAQSLAQQALDHLRGSPLRDRHPRLEAEALLRLGQARQRGGDARAARPELEAALALRAAQESADSPWLAETRVALADCLLDLGDLRGARPLLAEAARAQRSHAELGAHLKAPLQEASTRVVAMR